VRSERTPPGRDRPAGGAPGARRADARPSPRARSPHPTARSDASTRTLSRPQPSQRNLFSAQKGAAPEGTVEGEVVRVTYENESTGFRVIRVAVDGDGAERTLVGVFPPTPPGSRVRATGKAQRDDRHGEQFKVETLLTIAPSTLHGLERFLGSGLIKGIGPAFAKRIVDTFGADTIDVLDRTPERLGEVEGLGRKRVLEVQKAWEAHRVVGAIMIFLQAHGASPSLAARIYKRFGPRAVAIVSASPYRLALDVWGVGFKTADRIASSLGIARDAPERAQAGVLHVLHERSAQGHVYAERGELAQIAATMLEIDPALVEEAITALDREGRVRSEPLGDRTAIYTPELFEAEVRIAHGLAELLARPPLGKPLAPLAEPALRAFEERAGVKLAPAQVAAIELAANHKVLVITGGPGVGKTTIVRAVLGLFDRAGLKTRLAAPTGRAAKRMTEATGREAVTLHRLLEFEPKERVFQKNEDEPIDAGAIIVDEASMIDVLLMDALVSAVPKEARLVVVGDVDQLPSVGPGSVLADVIASGVVPTARLSAIFRQAAGSLIVENAHKIHAGEMPVGEQRSDGEFYVIERSDAEAARDAVVDLVTSRIPKRFGLDPRRDVQVLTPMHRGETGTIALNEKLQACLNPEGPSVRVGGRTLRLGDKVMQLKNDYVREVYNGDVGFVTKVEEETRTLTVRFDDREVPYEEGDLDELTLAYATSIHKSQGSEYPAVVIPMLMHHFVMLSRNLLYTAVTRGKRLVCLVSDPRAISLSLAETRREARSTDLAERLRRAARG
jgi:exodeoxyribonuclease V alpha subunit